METPRDEFPNNFVSDLVPTERGWVIVPPTCCPDGHDYTDPGWSVSSVWCTRNGRHMRWRCWCGKAIYTPQPPATWYHFAASDTDRVSFADARPKPASLAQARKPKSANPQAY